MGAWSVVQLIFDFTLFVFSISGGKDSCYNMMQCVEHGHDIVALANLKPTDGGTFDEGPKGIADFDCSLSFARKSAGRKLIRGEVRT